MRSQMKDAGQVEAIAGSAGHHMCACVVRGRCLRAIVLRCTRSHASKLLRPADHSVYCDDPNGIAFLYFAVVNTHLLHRLTWGLVGGWVLA